MFPNPIIRFDCSRQYLAQLRDHQFQRELANKYKDKVFWDTERELEVWRNQTKHDSHYFGHGYEYHAAIRIFEQYGYLSLVEKYRGHGKLRHPIKRCMVECVAGVEVAELLGQTGKGSVQCPDLFVFTKDHKEWCFVEVKGPTDRVRRVQRAVFASLEQNTGKPCYTAEIRLVDP